MSAAAVPWESRTGTGATVISSKGTSATGIQRTSSSNSGYVSTRNSDGTAKANSATSVSKTNNTNHSIELSIKSSGSKSYDKITNQLLIRTTDLEKVYTELFNEAKKNEKVDNVSGKNGTLSIGFSVNATALVGITLSIGIAMDRNGNIAIQGSYALPYDHENETANVGFVDAGFSKQVQVTNAPNIYALEGTSEAIGASSGFFKYFGFDMINLDKDGEFEGMAFQNGWGAGLDVHVTQGTTKTLWIIR